MLRRIKSNHEAAKKALEQATESHVRARAARARSEALLAESRDVIDQLRATSNEVMKRIDAGEIRLEIG